MFCALAVVAVGDDRRLRLLEKMQYVHAVELVVDDYEWRDFDVKATVSAHKVNNIVLFQPRWTPINKAVFLWGQTDFLKA